MEYSSEGMFRTVGVGFLYKLVKATTVFMETDALGVY